MEIIKFPPFLHECSIISSLDSSSHKFPFESPIPLICSQQPSKDRPGLTTSHDLALPPTSLEGPFFSAQSSPLKHSFRV